LVGFDFGDEIGFEGVVFGGVFSCKINTLHRIQRLNLQRHRIILITTTSLTLLIILLLPLTLIILLPLTLLINSTTFHNSRPILLSPLILLIHTQPVFLYPLIEIRWITVIVELVEEELEDALGF